MDSLPWIIGAFVLGVWFGFVICAIMCARRRAMVKKREVYEIAEDVLWARFIWQLIVVGASIVGIGLAVLAVMFL